jgi:hypothetical protein
MRTRRDEARLDSASLIRKSRYSPRAESGIAMAALERLEGWCQGVEDSCAVTARKLFSCLRWLSMTAVYDYKRVRRWPFDAPLMLRHARMVADDGYYHNV